jgi:hypothetical protein
VNFTLTQMPSPSSNAFDILHKTKKDVIKREIARLLDVDFIKEVYHLDWLDNPILLPKKNKEWRMCLDYTDLNKTYKKIRSACPASIKS